MLTLALIKAIEIIGEAASQVSQESKMVEGNRPWQNIIGMRHRLIHAYFDINLDVVWNTIVEDLPPLIKELERVLKKYN